MNEKIIKSLKWLNLTDRADKLSITNVAVYILLAKVATAPTIDWSVVAGLLVTLINYDRKRKAIQSEKSVELSTVAPPEAIEEIRKTANEAKELASKLSLAAGFNKLK